jgi:hypothetical protein
MDSQVFIDAARYAHIIAVAIGFGAAFLADYHVISRLGRPIDDNLTTTLHLCHSVIWAMVAAMWATGLVLVYIRTGFLVENVTPKLIAKVITVAILTGNAMLISRIAVPLVEQNRGRSLMWLPLRSKLCLAGIGAISSASWMLALAMGSSKVLAASDWIVFAFLMPVIYFLGVVAAVAVMYLLHLGGEMVTHRPLHRAVTGPQPVSVPSGQTAPARMPINHHAGHGQTAETPRERHVAIRMAAERKLNTIPQTDTAMSRKVAAE